MLKLETQKEHLNITVGRIKIRIGLHRLYKAKTPAIIILEQGGFGDYICCREFFRYLKLHNSDCRIIYICQDWTAQFSKIYDKEFIDEVISFNRNEFKSNMNYRKYFIKYINKTFNIKKYIHLTHFSLGYSRQLSWRMYFAKKIKAKEKYVGVIRYENKKESQLKTFNRLIAIKPYQFCVDGNKEFFEKILNIKIENSTQNFVIPPVFGSKKTNYILSVGASDDSKMFPMDKWVEIVNYLLNKDNRESKIIFVGIESEKNMIKEILSKINDSSRCINLAGEIDISTLPLILNSCKLMIAMESGNTHLAHVLNCPAICLCGGFYYKKSQPYDKSSVRYVYPPKFEEIINSKNESLLQKIYFDFEGLSVKDINSNQVISCIDSVLASKL